jgi:heat shock protein HslJ
MTKQILALFLIAVGLVLSSCAGTGSQQTDLNGTSWTLTQIQGKPVLADTRPDLSFDNGQASGTGSCNGFGGDYTLSGNKLTFGPLMSTMMACMPQEVMDQEKAYFSALNSTASFRVEGDRLTLLDAAGNVLAEFVAVK